MTIEPSPADMVLFAAVVREGGFTRAAKRLGLTKQTVSERVARLESQLGVRLLERTTRSVRVTEVGAPYFARCGSIATQIEEANNEVRRRQAEPVGRLRISAPVLYGRRFLAPVVADFVRRYPLIRVELHLSDRRVDLVEDGYDVAIRVGELEDTTLASRKIATARVACFASPTLREGRDPLTLETLGSWPCIGMRDQERWEIGHTTLRITPTLVVNDLEVACEAAAAGAGIVRAPWFVCAPAVQEGRLEMLFPGEPATVRSVHLVFPSRDHLPARVRLFVDAALVRGASLDAAAAGQGAS